MVLVNYHSQIIGERVILVPYRAEHVPKYHEWMKKQELLETTASEPLSMEEEIEMQKSWANDPDKCTFIMVDRSSMKESHKSSDDVPISLETSIEFMCGDVNTFLSTVDASEWYKSEDESSMSQKEELVIGEMEVMVAEEQSRRKGIAQEAVSLLMNYVKEHLNVDRFEVKIGKSNDASLCMFRQKLGFKDHRYYQCFEEYHLRYPDNTPIPSIPGDHLKIVDCPSNLGW